MRSTVTADVRLHGDLVGLLTYDRGGSAFEYRDDLASPSHRVLGQIFEDDPRTIRRVKTGLPAWFANLLPEGELRRQVVREMGGGTISDYRLLVRLGADLPGAVTVEAVVEPDDLEDVTAEDLPSDAANHPLRYSLAGVQLKYSIHSERLTLPTSGEDSWWIVKLPDRGVPQVTENEYLTMRWLQAADMDVPRVELLPSSAVRRLPAGFVRPDDMLYVVERFDRSATGRVHVEDFAQVADADPRHKYGEFGATYDGLGNVVHHLTGEPGFRTYLERLVAVVVTGNTDAHLKNWAPLALSLAGESMPDRIERDHLCRLAEACGSDPDRAAVVVSETMVRLRAAWDAEIKSEAERRFPALAEHYQQRLRELPVART